MTTLKQIQEKYPSYEVTKVEGKRLYIVSPIGEETWPETFRSLVDVEEAIAGVEAVLFQRKQEKEAEIPDLEIYSSHAGYEYQIFEDYGIVKYAKVIRVWDTRYHDYQPGDVIIMSDEFNVTSGCSCDIEVPEPEYVPEETELDAKLELVSTEHGKMVFCDNKQTPLLCKNGNWFYGDRRIDIKALTELLNSLEDTQPIPQRLIPQPKSNNRLGRLPENFKQYEEKIKACLECFDSYTKRQRSTTCCSWLVRLNGYNATVYLSSSLDWEIQSKTPEQFPDDLTEFFADNGIELD